jgi:hypothetical protein
MLYPNPNFDRNFQQFHHTLGTAYKDAGEYVSDQYPAPILGSLASQKNRASTRSLLLSKGE